MDLHMTPLRILSHLGGSPLKYYVVLCWHPFLSMWMSNTATAMMMLPIVFQLLQLWKKRMGRKS
jgi:sodium-dependent dicarboxylate transporter 2/3/5